MLGHGGSSAGSYLADPTSAHPLALCCNYPVSKCPSASIVATSTLRVNLVVQIYMSFSGLSSLGDCSGGPCLSSANYIFSKQLQVTVAFLVLQKMTGFSFTI